MLMSYGRIDNVGVDKVNDSELTIDATWWHRKIPCFREPFSDPGKLQWSSVT